ncbi:MAG TPA: hypothetical protein VKB05_12940 [Pyrinomonadaceae bacterium]|nr:hypothetical protein [Pyrinomonadaceae bacterium]
MARTLSYDYNIFISGVHAGIGVAVRAIVNTQSKTAADAISVSGHAQTFPAPFANDPTWDSFMRSIEEYRDLSDAFERSLE